MPTNPRLFLSYRRKAETAVDPFVYPLASLQDASILMKFKENFQNWSKGTEI